MRNIAKPVILGAAMGLMGLAMVHGMLTQSGGVAAVAGLLFITAHLAAGLLGLVLAVFAARLSPKVKSWIHRLPRPSLSHVLRMGGGAAFAIGLAHLSLHGAA